MNPVGPKEIGNSYSSFGGDEYPHVVSLEFGRAIESVVKEEVTAFAKNIVSKNKDTMKIETDLKSLTVYCKDKAKALELHADFADEISRSGSVERKV